MRTTGKFITAYMPLALVMAVVMIAYSSCKSSSKSTKTPPPTVTKPQPGPQPVKPAEPKPEPGKKVSVTFSVIMPFELRDNFAPVEDETAEPVIVPGSQAAIHFYEGAQIAIDSLRKQGFDVTVRAYDSPDDSLSLKRMLSSSAIKSSQVVFASLPNHLNSVAAGYASVNNINLVLSSASDNALLKGKTSVVISHASTETQCRQMVAGMLSQFPGSNIILVWRNTRREDELAEFFRSELKILKGTSVIHDINANLKGINEVAALLSKTRRNLVFVVSSDEAFVNPLLSKLEEQNIGEIAVSGLPTWEGFESIDFMTFQNLRIFIFDNNYIDYTDLRRTAFRNEFIRRYHNDPLPYAFNAFELIYGMGKNIDSQTPDMSKLLERTFPEGGPYFDFETVKFDVTGKAGGLENRKISILQFREYQLRVVR